jgi:hypothetical protein
MRSEFPAESSYRAATSFQLMSFLPQAEHGGNLSPFFTAIVWLQVEH